MRSVFNREPMAHKSQKYWLLSSWRQSLLTYAVYDRTWKLTFLQNKGIESTGSKWEWTETGWNIIITSLILGDTSNNVGQRSTWYLPHNSGGYERSDIWDVVTLLFCIMVKMTIGKYAQKISIFTSISNYIQIC